MTPLLFYFLKVALCSAILTGYYFLALRNKVFHQWNRFYLLAAVGLSILLPAVSFPLPTPAAEPANIIRLLQVMPAFNEEEVVVADTPALLLYETIWGIVYAAVIIILFFFCLASLLRIRRLIRTEGGIDVDGIHLIQSKAPGTPFSFLHHIFWNPAIDLQSETGRQIFNHEVVHVREGHTWDKLGMQTVLIFFWANPFFWIIRNELRWVHEFIADKKAVGNNDTAALAAMIVQSLYPAGYTKLTNAFFHSSIKRRLAMLRKINNPQRSYLNRIFVLPLLAVITAAFTLKPALNEQSHKIGSETLNYTGQENHTTAVYKPILRNISGIQVLDDEIMILTYKHRKAEKVSMAEAKTKGPIGVSKYIYNNKRIDTIPKIEFNSAEIESVNITSDSTAEIKLRNGKTAVYKAKDLRKTMGGHAITIRPDGKHLRKGENVYMKGRIKIKTGDSTAPKSLIFIDGEEYTANKNVLEQIDPSTIESINILKGESAAAVYGERGRQGVIQIKLKPGTSKPSKSKQVSKSSIQRENVEVVYITREPKASWEDFTVIKAEVEPQFPGGAKEWQKYLMRTIDMSSVKGRDAPEGTHVVKATFIINTDGSLEQIQATTKNGYGMDEQVVQLLKVSPKWEAAIQNGRKVRSQHEVNISFVINSAHRFQQS